MSRRPSLFGRVAPSGSERVVSRLHGHGVSLVISLPGSQVLPMWEALDRTEGMRLIVPRTERSGAFIGEGYGLAKGLPAVVANTLGPGVANEAAPMASALLSEAPVIFLAPSQPPNKRRRIDEVFQGLDHSSYLEGAALEQVACDDAQDIEASIDAALAASLGDPSGPVRLDISFPVLFSRSPKRTTAPMRKLPPRPPLVGKGAEVLLALESSAAESGQVLAAAGLADDPAVTPGLDEPGFGVSFALGLRLGRTRAPVVLATDIEALLSQLEAIVVAQHNGVRVTLGTLSDSASASQVREVAGQLGAALMPIDSGASPEEVRASILERQRSLTILVG